MSIYEQSIYLVNGDLYTIGGVNLKFEENMDEKIFTGKTFDNLKVECKYVTACDFTHTLITNADIYGTVLCSSNFSAAEILNSKLCKCDCSYTNFSMAKIINTEFIRDEFMYSNLRNTVLSDVIFYGTNIYSSTDFSGCDFSNVIFRSFIFEGNFKGAVFSNISFEEIFWEHCKINIGTDDKPIYLYGEDIKQWILNGGAK